MTLVCQGVVFQLRNPLRNKGVAAKMGTFRRGGFHSCEMRGEGEVYEIALVCQEGVSQLRKFSQKEGMGLQNYFSAMGRFRSSFLRLRNYLATKGHFRRGPF